ncbi:toll/interleukin-1 receptor domain-containing protein [Xanthobacter sp. V4C-4]|uniref:toll/interleukin-1 receptor domain-containing protein n=1 Tax=Xanthobacter cornucopiae TaxID=3119924 RepID=UPI00372A25C2
MKIFISHQKTDSALALGISSRLKLQHGIDSYLDVIDPETPGAGDDLADLIRARLGTCTQLLAVISQATRTSWWVPWEIGVASEKEYPLATYSGGGATPPEYLRKWPYLRSDMDLDHYAMASKTASRDFATKRAYLNESAARARSTKEFYRSLRGNLGQ